MPASMISTTQIISHLLHTISVGKKVMSLGELLIKMILSRYGIAALTSAGGAYVLYLFTSIAVIKDATPDPFVNNNEVDDVITTTTYHDECASDHWIFDDNNGIYTIKYDKHPGVFFTFENRTHARDFLAVARNFSADYISQLATDPAKCIYLRDKFQSGKTYYVFIDNILNDDN